MPVIKTNASALLGVPIDDTDKGANKVLKYNAGTGKFEYEDDATASPGGGATQMSELSDVSDSISISAGHYLRSGTETWSNSAIAAADLPTAIDAAKIANGSVSNTEFQYLDGVTSAIQTQLNAKAASTHAHAAGDITSGTLAVAQGGTNAATAADARTSLGLVIGTNVQAYDATLATLATLGTAANKVPYFTATDTGGELTLRTTLRDAGTADDTSLATEAAVRAAIVAGAGDVTSNTSSSVVNELAAFADTGGKLIKRTTESGIAKLTSGVLSAITAPSGTIVGTTDTQTLSNKTLQDSTTVFQDNADATKQFRFEVSSVTAGQTRVLTVPNADLTLATLTGTETFTNKTLTNPTLNAGDGVLVVPQKATPDQTAEGSVQWDTDGDLLTVGTGAARKTMVDTDSTQTLAAKILTTPTIAATGFTNANHAHAAANSGGQLDLTAIASNTPTARYALIANTGGTAWQVRALTIADVSDVTTATGTQNDMIVKGASTWETKSPGQVRTILQIGSHPTTTVDNTVARYDGTTGDLQASSVTIDDSNNVAAAGNLTLGGGAASSELRILEPSGDGSSYTGFKAPALAANVVYTLPAADGTTGQYLKTDGSKVLSWESPAGAGDVVGPSSATDNAIVRYDSTTGKLVQGSTVTVGDTGVIAAASGTLTLTSPYLTTPQINDTSADHQYVFAVNELAADRTVTLPQLTGNDSFVFEAHTQNLTNKTVNKVTVTAPATAATLTLADGSSLITAGAYPVTLTATATTGVTLPTTGTLATLTGTETFTNKTLTTPKFADLGYIADANGEEMLQFDTVGSATCWARLANSTTGASKVILSAQADGSNCDLALASKGSGSVLINDQIPVTTAGNQFDTNFSAKTTLADNDRFLIEDSASSDDKKYVVWSNVVPAASDTVAGKIEVATTAETNTGTSGTLAVSPDGLAGSYAGTKVVQVQVVADATDVTTSSVGYFYIPECMNGMNLVRAQAFVATAGTTNATTIQLRNLTKFASNDALSSPISIASAGTVGTAGTVDTSYDAVDTNDRIKISVTGVSTTAPKGLYVSCEYRLP